MNHSSGSNQRNRRNIIYWAAGALSTLMFWKVIRTGEKKEKPVKMLTEDGRLVEVDRKYLTGQRRKVNTDEIHNWVKNK